MQQRPTASVATREFVRPPCTRMCVQHQGRAKNFRPDQQGEKRGCEACTYARPYSYTAFLVVVVVGCLLYFRFFLRPLVSTPLASHATRPNEKLVARRETALVKFRPFSSFRETVSHFSLFSLFPSFFFFLFLFFRFCVALRFSKGGFTLSLGTLSICY